MTTGLHSIGQRAIGVHGAADSEAGRRAHKAVFAPRMQLPAARQNTCTQRASFGAGDILPAFAAQTQTAPARFQTARHIHIRLIVP